MQRGAQCRVKGATAGLAGRATTGGAAAQWFGRGVGAGDGVWAMGADAKRPARRTARRPPWKTVLWRRRCSRPSGRRAGDGREGRWLRCGMTCPAARAARCCFRRCMARSMRAQSGAVRRSGRHRRSAIRRSRPMRMTSRPQASSSHASAFPEGTGAAWSVAVGFEELFTLRSYAGRASVARKKNWRLTSLILRWHRNCFSAQSRVIGRL